MTWTLDAARDLAAEWADKLKAQGGRLDKGVAEAEALAVAAAGQLAEQPFAAVSYEPGNGTSYGLAFAVLPSAVGAMWGGRLLVALPEWNDGGRSCAFGLGYEIDPWAVEDHLHLRTADAVPVAMLLTLLSASLAERGIG